jgi:hypothetical protein
MVINLDEQMIHSERFRLGAHDCQFSSAPAGHVRFDGTMSSFFVRMLSDSGHL